jgi:glycosyltransferase involved in cell wall biosynthesis
MSDALRISVVIPAYNAEKYLAEALESVWAQTRQPFEVVAIDDGSTDGTAAVLEANADRIRTMRQENQGICAARNAGIAMAEGDVIAFLDSDDLWPEESLEARAAVLEADPDLDGVVGVVEQFLCPRISEDQKDQYVVPPESRVGRLAGAMLLRRRAFDKAGMFNPAVSMGDTMDWVLRADAAGVTMKPLDTLVLRRRIHGSNFTVKQKPDQAGYLKILKAHLDRQRQARGAGQGDG